MYLPFQCPVSNALVKSSQEESVDEACLQPSEYTIYSTIEDLPQEWDVLSLQSESVFLERQFLSVLELSPPIDMQFRYIVFYKNERPIGCAYVQIQDFEAKKSLQNLSTEGFSNKLKSWVASKVKFRTLICGNSLLSGEHGFYFEANICHEDAMQSLHSAMEDIRQQLKIDDRDAPLFLWKDFAGSGNGKATYLKEELKYFVFEVQPCMCMTIRPHWEKFEDYLADFQSKYRVRAKRAFKKGKDIQKKDFSLEDIKANKDKLNELFHAVVSKVDFTTFQLHSDYFFCLKKLLGEEFKLTGYYLNDELVAFYTTIQNGNELEAHFLGLNGKYNHSYQLYLNILYDIVRTAIDLGKEHINFARTALEIKSSIGAVAKPMVLAMRHQKTLQNALLSRIYSFLEPNEDWQPRHPFKVEQPDALNS